MRLKQRAEFVAVAKGRRSHMSALSVQALRRTQNSADDNENANIVTKGARFGLTVTNKTGNSPERNRMRRRLREVLRLADLPSQDTFDYVIIARRDVLSLPFKELEHQLCVALRRVHEQRKSEKQNPGKPASQRPSGISSSSDQTG